MKAPILILLSILLLASCSSTDEDALLPTDTSSAAILQDLSQSKWKLIDCPDQELLNINGQSECRYLDDLFFQGNKVIITYRNSNIGIQHHICYASADRMVVSLQDCANTTWKSLFEWDVVSRNGNMMIMNISAPNLDPSYSQRFTFEKTN